MAMARHAAEAQAQAQGGRVLWGAQPTATTTATTKSNFQSARAFPVAVPCCAVLHSRGN